MVVVFCQAQQAPVLMTAKYNYSNNSLIKMSIKMNIPSSSTNSCETAPKTNCIHYSCNAGFFWEAEQGYLSLTTKDTRL